MSFTARLSVFFLLAGLALIWLGTRKVRNRRRADVLGAPSEACRRSSVESVP